MRSLWWLTAAIGAAVLIFTQASLVGVVIGVAFLGLSVLLLLRPVGRTELYS
jgi:multisubunit Na+/H+ antiporter MnhC subunit